MINYILAQSTSLLVRIPVWAKTNEAKIFVLGMGVALTVRIFRFMLRNFKRMGREDFS
jgi:hypothetical protein